MHGARVVSYTIPFALCSIASAANLHTNLLTNPGFEQFALVEDGPVILEGGNPNEALLLGWEAVGSLDQTAQLNLNRYDGQWWGDVTPPSGGDWVLFGGAEQPFSTITQSVSLSFASGLIDAGAAGFELSGWLGSFGAFAGGTPPAQEDIATLSAMFFDIDGDALGTFLVDGPSNPIAPVGGNVGPLNFSEFVSISGLVPVGARSALVSVSFTRDADALPTSFNNANADSLDFHVVPAPGTAALGSMMLFLIRRSRSGFSRRSTAQVAIPRRPSPSRGWTRKR